jgi:23S rRNA-/tRNA-specific pseudouridylate synthase
MQRNNPHPCGGKMNTPPVPIVASGAGWLLADKPSGMSVHNDPGIDLCSRLIDYLHANTAWCQTVQLDPTFGLHPVHRLDRETSGLILLACRRDVFHYFSEAFASNRVVKHYLCLVHGTEFRHDDEGLWTWPLTPKAAGRRDIRGRGHRVDCMTAYRVIQRSRRYTLLGCRLFTGRTHQIRRHAALAGHPILGDRRYGPLRACRYLEKHHGFSRLALHCAGIRITAPGSKTERLYESSRLPEAIKHLYDADS